MADVEQIETSVGQGDALPTATPFDDTPAEFVAR